MKRFRAFTTRHPILSQLAGWLLFLVLALAFLPKDDGDSVARVQQRLEKCV
jgi:hypothetical protein